MPFFVSTTILNAKYGIEKPMVWARFSVSDVDATPTSARPEVSAGMRSGNGVSTYSGFTPSAAARSLQVSTS